MVTNLKSEFASKLVTALKASGYPYFGKLENLDLLYDDFKDYSPQEMARKFAEKNNLEQVNLFLRLLDRIFNNELKSLLLWANDNNVLYKPLAYAIRHVPFVKVTGAKANTRYLWTDDGKPTFRHGKELAELFNSILKYELPDKIKKEIAEAFSMAADFDDFIKEKQYSVEERYKIQDYFRVLKNNQRDKNNAKKRIITEAVIARKPVDMPEITTMSESRDKIDGDPITKMEFEMLKMENEYLKKMLSSKDKYILKLKSMIEALGNPASGFNS